MTTSNQDPTTPTGNIWLANYALHLETERTTRSVSSTDAFVGLRIRCVGNSFAIAAQLLGPTEPIEFWTSHASALALARFFGSTLPEEGREVSVGDAPLWTSRTGLEAMPEPAPLPEPEPIWVTLWEYHSIKRTTLNLEGLIADLNQLGSEGWELVNFDTSDRTLGMNAYVALLRRPYGRRLLARTASDSGFERAPLEGIAGSPPSMPS
ncbi:MAG: hypothetical protein F2934_12620 [Actinobacteria bacterium]|uniref:Unannotated protein n=1 Tax=freshwater metagenome TaxID=449393 RepID=A0A6J7US02_9ZZZZ|nr:hypothetical protein [Actinomycetota bacterium]MTB07960.1 hypothetical protein [Actinomycetota bacterium]